MLTDQFYDRCLIAQSQCLKQACDPKHYELSMRAYNAIGEAIKKWDKQQLTSIRRTTK